MYLNKKTKNFKNYLKINNFLFFKIQGKKKKKDIDY